MPQTVMKVTKTTLETPTTGVVEAESVNGAIQGTMILKVSKTVAKSLDPGDEITVNFAKN